jgi:hypothetical protein
MGCPVEPLWGCLSSKGIPAGSESSMGGYGSGRNGGPTVESAVRLDTDNLVRRGAIELGAHLRGSMRFDFYDQELSIEFESKAVASEASWLRLKYDMTDYWSDEDCKIDDLISLKDIRHTVRYTELFTSKPREPASRAGVAPFVVAAPGRA